MRKYPSSIPVTLSSRTLTITLSQIQSKQVIICMMKTTQSHPPISLPHPFSYFPRNAKRYDRTRRNEMTTVPLYRPSSLTETFPKITKIVLIPHPPTRTDSPKDVTPQLLTCRTSSAFHRRPPNESKRLTPHPSPRTSCAFLALLGGENKSE